MEGEVVAGNNIRCRSIPIREKMGALLTLGSRDCQHTNRILYAILLAEVEKEYSLRKAEKLEELAQELNRQPKEMTVTLTAAGRGAMDPLEFRGGMTRDGGIDNLP
jgi:hypothetical protein